MKKIIIIFLFSLISVNLFGTAQIPDVIIYNGDTLLLHSCPLFSFPEEELMINPKNLFGSRGCFYTACWRNYVATWEVINNELFLTEIKNACYPTSMKDVAASYKSVEEDSIGCEFADLKTLFPKRFRNGKVRADWVNDTLNIPQGKLLYYVHSGFASTYETELELIFKNGVLIGSRQLDNTKTKQSEYTKNQKLLTDFIYNNIKLENLPASDSIKRRVVVLIKSADDNGKIDSVEILQGINELYDKEAIRIVKSIPEWNVIYKHGKKINQYWTIPIRFDLNALQEKNAFVKEAKSFFEEKMKKVRDDFGTRKLKGLATDFIPQWDGAVLSNKKDSSMIAIDVPIIADYIFEAVIAANDTINDTFSQVVLQKLVVIKNLKTTNLSVYIVSIIPERDYVLSKEQVSAMDFSNYGDYGYFSGLIIYSYPLASSLVRINRYIGGKVVDKATLLGLKNDLEKRQSAMDKMKRLMNGMRIHRKSRDSIEE